MSRMYSRVEFFEFDLASLVAKGHSKLAPVRLRSSSHTSASLANREISLNPYIYPHPGPDLSGGKSSPREWGELEGVRPVGSIV